MMRKFICSDFELDLTGFKITDTAENPWLTGTYFTKYSYPFSASLTDELDMMLGYISHHNSGSATTLISGTYVFGDIMEEAVLEVEELQNEISMSIRYGLDDFPNFTKPLKELPLHGQDVSDIYDHAATIVSKTWPEVNYNFPALHTDMIDTDQDEWADFKKIINFYTGGVFPRNEFDLEEEVSHNRNIIQPLPYVLHILQAGFADAGRTLTGDILNDALIKSMLVFTDAEYFTTLAQESFVMMFMSEEFDTITYGTYYPRILLTRTLEINQPGRYRITGDLKITVIDGHRPATIYIKYRGSVLYYFSYRAGLPHTKPVQVDVVFDKIADYNEIVFEYDGGFREDIMICNLEINPIRLHDDSGNPIATIINPNTIQLTRVVPDMTFGDFVKLLLTMFNLSLDTTATEARMNYITNEISNSAVTDLSAFEVRRPKRTYSKGTSYLVQYDEINSEVYSWAKVFQNASGTTPSGYTTDDKTQEITLNALPLPLLYRNSTLTAHAFLNDTSKPMFVLYNGLTGFKNVTQDPAALLIPALHSTYLSAWLAKLIDAVEYEWTFLAYMEQLQDLTVKGRVHAYHNIHLVKSIEKTSLPGGVIEVQLTSSVLT
jgi:hypothetical protein